MHVIKKITAVVLLCTTVFHLKAQVRPLTDDQYFKNNFKGIVESLPIVTRWTDNNHFLMIKNGKTFLVDAKTGIETESSADKMPALPVAPTVMISKNEILFKSGGTESVLSNDSSSGKKYNALLSPDNNYIAYTMNNDLYTIEVRSKKKNRITNDGSETILNGYASWVYMEEILGRSSKYKSYWWSPDSKHIAFFRTDDSPVPVYTITDADGIHGYVEKMRYPKVGDPNPQVKIGIVSPEGGNIIWADFNNKEDQYFGMPYWKPDGKTLLVQWMNRKQNQLKIWAVDPVTGNKKSFYSEEQKTWIDLDDNERIQFLKNGKGLLLLSDMSGWKHIYHFDINGKLVNMITSGKYSVEEISYVDEKKNLLYFIARGIENSARKDYYSINLNGKNLKRLTSGNFNHSYINTSPDASYFISTSSNVSTPPIMSLYSGKGKMIKELGNSKGVDFSNSDLALTEIVRVISDDSLFNLPMKITWPTNRDKSKKYPVLISIYGGPNAGTLMDSWSLSGNQQWYAKEGLIQVVMDHRASGHFGKTGVNYMYHNLGYWEMKDYSTMVKWLIKNANADSSKICITGFSYGGYLSTYALTYGADVFTHGMAGGSVVDWKLYDSHYAERFMGTEADNKEGYKSSSSLNYVDRYKGMLQIVHGVIDENVHLQNSIQLISALQDKKKDFEFMMYSGGRHGWGGNKSVHFQNLKTKFVYRYLLEKPVPKGLLK